MFNRYFSPFIKLPKILVQNKMLKFQIMINEQWCWMAAMFFLISQNLYHDFKPLNKVKIGGTAMSCPGSWLPLLFL